MNEDHTPVKEEPPINEVPQQPPKKKRARKDPTAAAAVEMSMERPQTPEIQTSAASILASSKPFFPYPNHFPVPGLIPPPLFQNVPFNLLGMPMAAALRPPLNVPALNLSGQVNFILLFNLSRITKESPKSIKDVVDQIRLAGNLRSWY